MPITYSIDKPNGIIVEVWTGEVAASVLAEHWKILLADPDALAIRRTLVDLRNCHIDFLGRELFELIRTMVEPRLNGRGWRTALLVSDGLQFGVSRQYQSFAQTYSDDAIFDEPNVALSWLIR